MHRVGADRLHILALAGEYIALAGNAVRIMALAGILGLVIIFAAPFQEKLFSAVWMAALPAKISQLISTQITRFLVGMRACKAVADFVIYPADRRHLVGGCSGYNHWSSDHLTNPQSGSGAHLLSALVYLAQFLPPRICRGLPIRGSGCPGAFGFLRSEALAYILISQILGYLVVSLWGLLGLWQLNNIMHKPLIKNLTIHLRDHRKLEQRGLYSRCLNALVAQTSTDFEVVLVDNGSTDGCMDGVEAAGRG